MIIPILALQMARCDFCRHKHHLIGGNPNVTICQSCPDHVKDELLSLCFTIDFTSTMDDFLLSTY